MNQSLSTQLDTLFDGSIAAIESARVLHPKVIQAAQLMADSLETGGKILVCGNGGSAADSLHFSSELLNKFLRIRRPLAAICLCADISTLTSIGNDESYDHVFSKQVEALGRKEDVLVVITSSGQSPSILQAVQAAHDAKISVVTLNGRDGGALSPMLNEHDIDIVVPQKETARIQEVHGIIIHAFCQLIDQQLFGDLTDV